MTVAAAQALVEKASGKPVLIQPDPDLKLIAKIVIARGDAPAHVVTFNPKYGEAVDYHLVYQCGYALRMYLTPTAERFDVVSTRGWPEFVEALRDIVAREYQALGGWAQIVVNEGDRTLKVTWGSAANRPGPLESAVEKLRRGQYNAAIQTLEVLRFQQPDNPVVVFNLGMALSDRGRLSAAITHLRRATQLAPNDANAHVALGVALARDDQTTAAIASFREGVRLDETNPWAHRNLGVCLLRDGKPDEAEPHLRRAVELSPTDPASRVGLGQCLVALGQLEDADIHLAEAIRFDPHGRIGEAAKAERSRIAQTNFRSRVPGAERPDAVMYCLGALERFEPMPLQEVQKIGLEIAVLGTGGIDPNDADKRYTLKTLPGEYSGLQLLCLMFVAFKAVAPDRDIGFDVSREYQTAVAMHTARKGKPES